MGSASSTGREGRPRTVHRNQVKGNSLLETGPKTPPDPEAIRERTHRLLELLTIYVRQGYLDPAEIEAALGQPSGRSIAATLDTVRGRMVDLEAELRFDRTFEEFLGEEAAALETELSAERRRLEWSINRIASLELQLHEAQRTTLKLVAASEGSLATLQKARTDLVPEALIEEALTPLARDLERMARTAQELQTVAAAKATPPPAGPSES